MGVGYFATAWADIKNSDGWLKKLLLLGLVGLIPIFGQIVLLGYAWGWARDIAWNVHRPLPEKIFGNEDGKLYSRGFFLLVLAFVFALVPNVVQGLFNGMITASSVGASMYDDYSSALALTGLGLGGMLVSLAVFALSIAAEFFTWVGSVRTAIYGRLSAGFQVTKIWAMLKHDFNGILRIFGMVILVGLVFGLVLSVVFFIVVVFCLAGTAATAGMSIDRLQGFTALAALGPWLGVFMVFALAIGYCVSAFSAFLELLTARAVGYWTRQFDVPQWRGQDEPMPFEAAEAAARAAAPYAYAAPQWNAPVAGVPQQDAPTAQAPQQDVPFAEASVAAEPAAPAVAEPVAPAPAAPEAVRPTPEQVQAAIAAKQAAAPEAPEVAASAPAAPVAPEPEAAPAPAPAAPEAPVAEAAPSSAYLADVPQATTRFHAEDAPVPEQDA